MKTAKKSLALLLALLMCLSLFSTMAFAEDAKTEYNLVCIGDSTSNGYGLDDYDQKDYDVDTQGCFGQISSASYPAKLASYIQSKLGDSYDVKLSALTLQGMRTDEFRAILDPSFREKAQEKGHEHYTDDEGTDIGGDQFNRDHMQMYDEWFNKNFDTLVSKGDTTLKREDLVEGTPIVTAVFTEAIKNAEVIVVDTTMNNFGTYLCQRLESILGEMDGWKVDDYSETVEDLAEELKALGFDVAAAKAAIKELLVKNGIELPEMIDQFLEMFLYCYCDFCVNFSANMAMLLELNPNAKIIVVGAYNSMSGLKATLGDTDVDFGALWGSFMGLVNTFITTNAYADKYCYADCTGNIQTFINSMNLAKAADDMSLIDDSYKELLAKDIVGQFKGALGTPEQAAQTLGLLNTAITAIDTLKNELTGDQALEFACGMDADLNKAVQDYPAYFGSWEAIVENAGGIADTYVGGKIAQAKAQIEPFIGLKSTDEAFAVIAAMYPALGDAGISNYSELLVTKKVLEVYVAGDLGDLVLEMYVKASDVVFDMGTLFGSLAGLDIEGLVKDAVFSYVATGDWDSVDPIAKMLLHLNARFLTARGLGCHPDSVGVKEKGLRVIAAYEKTTTAKDDGQSAIADLGKNVFNAAWTTLKTPIFDAIKNAFNKFASTIQNILNTIFQPVFSIFDKIPSC